MCFKLLFETSSCCSGHTSWLIIVNTHLELGLNGCSGVNWFEGLQISPPRYEHNLAWLLSPINSFAVVRAHFLLLCATLSIGPVRLSFQLQGTSRVPFIFHGHNSFLEVSGQVMRVSCYSQPLSFTASICSQSEGCCISLLKWGLRPWEERVISGDSSETLLDAGRSLTALFAPCGEWNQLIFISHWSDKEGSDKANRRNSTKT